MEAYQRQNNAKSTKIVERRVLATRHYRQQLHAELRLPYAR